MSAPARSSRSWTPGQGTPGQLMPGQPVPGQPVPGQPVPGQPVPGQEGDVVPVDMAALAGELAAESAVTRALVAGLDEADWRTPTPAAGWNIADQIGHLAYFDEVAVRSAVRTQEFLAELAATGAEVRPNAIA